MGTTTIHTALRAVHVWGNRLGWMLTWGVNSLFWQARRHGGRLAAELRAEWVKGSERSEGKRLLYVFSWETPWLVCGQLTRGTRSFRMMCFSSSVFDFYHRRLLDCVSKMTFKPCAVFYDLDRRWRCCFHCGSYWSDEGNIYIYTCSVLHRVPPGDFNTAGRCCLLCAVTEVVQLLTKLEYRVILSARRLSEAQFDLCVERRSK